MNIEELEKLSFKFAEEKSGTTSTTFGVVPDFCASS